MNPLGIVSETESILSGETPILPPDALLEANSDGKQFRLIDSKAAAIVAAALKGRLAWDGEAGAWQLWQGTHWEPLNVAAKAESLLAEVVDVGTFSLGYRVTYLNGITQIIQRRGLLRPMDRPGGVIPFADGLLDLDTGALTPATPARALNWCLPHAYDSRADCPTIKAWLLRSVEGDTGTVEFLRAWLAALLRGVRLQIFLLLLGRGKCGKGVFQRLAVALIGSRNAAISTLRDLEENRFETAKLYGKRLCMINESGKHGGALNMLKAITGGDHLPLERKHVQQAGSFVFGGLVLMATNEGLESTDSTSGLERRRITVRFPISATPAEVEDWEPRGGEEAVLHPEIPGLIRWLLELSPADIRARIENPPARIVSDNLLGMAAGNSVADWLQSETSPDPNAWTQIGDKREGRDPATGKTFFEYSDTRLYPSYLTWMLRAGRQRPVSLRKFRDTVIDIAETLGHPVFPKEHPEKRTRGIQGLRLRDDGPLGPRGSEWANDRIEPAYREDREDTGQNFGAEDLQKRHAPVSDGPEVER